MKKLFTFSLFLCHFFIVSADSSENVTALANSTYPTVIEQVESQNDTRNATSSFVPMSIIPNNVTLENETSVQEPESLTPVTPSADLQKCAGFQDDRSKKTSDLLINIPGNLTNSDQSVHFRISGEPTQLECKSGGKTMRTVKWEHGKRLVVFKTNITLDRMKASGKTSNHFTHEGYLHIDGNYYHPKKDYCIKSLNDSQIEVETCNITCSDSDKICIPKCCGPDEILEYWTFRCKKIGVNETKWNPKLHDLKYPHKMIGDLTGIDEVHIMRRHIQCPEGLRLERWPLTDTVGAVKAGKVDPGISWKLVPNTRPIYISERREWVHVPEGSYCVDGYANWGRGGNGKYTGDHESHSVLLICPTGTKFVEFSPGKAWLYSIALLFSSLFLLFTAIIHVLLMDKQHLHGLTVLCHALSMFFLYVFCAIAHIISIYPELKGGVRSPFCMSVAILSHYFFMTTFTWLTVMNFDLWLTFRSMRPVSKMSKRIRRFRIYFLIGWGLPAILSGAFYTVNEIYKEKTSEVVVPEYAIKSCFVAIWSRGHYMYSLVAIALSINTVLVLWTFYIFYEFRKQNANTFVNRKTKSDKYSVRLFIKLFCVMGVAWFVELLSWAYNGESKPWPVVILDCVMFFQAFAIFFIFCINRRTLKQLEEKYPGLRKFIRPLQTFKWFKAMNSDAEGGVEMTTPGSTPRKLSLSVTTHSKIDSTLPRKTSASSVRSTSISASSPVNPNGGIMEDVNLDSDDGGNESVKTTPDLLSDM